MAVSLRLPAPSADDAQFVGSRERWAAAALLVGMFLLRLVYVFHYRIDSDEPQHLHLVWGWTHGLLPYRDLFDNHAPLFHLLCTPLLAGIGERVDALYLMRLAMFPMFATVLLCVHALGRALFGPRVALWATVLAGLWPQHFLTSIEFRTDDLWAAFWMLSLVAVVCGRWRRMRAFLAGLLLGAAFGVSMKSSLMLLALAGAALATLALVAQATSTREAPARAPRAIDLAAHGALVIAGLAIVPGALAWYFAVRGDLAGLRYCTIDFNILPGLGLWSASPLREILFPAALPVLWLGARALVRSRSGLALGWRRAFVLLAAGLYVVALFSFWPLLTSQDFLPFLPLAVLLILPLLFAVPRRSLAPRLRIGWATVVVLAIAGELTGLVIDAPPWQDATRPQRNLVSDVLRLTRPSESVMDLKGDSVFRPRPFYWVLEGVTKERIRRGLIPDRIPERLLATRTAVVEEDSEWFPPRARRFMNANYVPVGSVRVLGRFLDPDSTFARRAIRFEVAISERYALVTRNGPARGWLDGEPYRGPRLLVPGAHVYRRAAGEGRIALVWARALERGYSPFAPGNPEP